MAELPYTTTQMSYASEIASVGRSRGMSNRDILTAITVVLAESDLQMYANSNVPGSLSIPHEKIGSDHNSVGLFQQQVGIWGTASELMDVKTSANKFYDALAKVPGRELMSVPQLAQTVQKSAFSDGDNYAKRQSAAEQIMQAIGGSTDTYTEGSKTVVDPLKWIADTGNWQRIGLFALGGAIIVFALVKILSGNKTVKLAAEIATKGIVK